MEQLLLHLFGDFILQFDFLALNKKEFTLKGWLLCILHCLIYSLPFLLITNLDGVILIFIFHFFIDKTNVIEYYIKVRNNLFNGKNKTTYSKNMWLIIISNNTIHLIINYLIIYYTK